MMPLPVIAYQSPRCGDLSGQRTQYTHPNGTRTEYEYDPSEYVSHWYANFYGDGSATLPESYAYNTMVRRTSANGVAYTYNDDQLLAVGSGAGAMVYEHNDNGYRTERYAGEDYSTQYAYTTAGQLVGVSQYVYDSEGEGAWEPDAPAVTYQLDALGRRVAKLVGGSVQERYPWAGHNTTLLAVYGPTGTTPIARFEYGVGRMPMRMTQGSNTYYFAYDQVGSLRAIYRIAITRTLVRQIKYDTFGNISQEIAAQGYENLCVPFGFAGGLHDRDTGMVLFGFRDYDPKTGTWLTPDPIGFAGGDVYLYGYCGGDPVNWVDADGLQHYSYGTNFIPSDGYSACIRDMISGVQDIVGGIGLGNLGSVGGMTSSFATGFGRTNYFFDGHSPESAALTDSPIVAKSWEFFGKKNAGRSYSEKIKVTNFQGKFGGKEVLQATMNGDIIEHFVGSARVDIYPHCDGTATVVITNTSSVNSLCRSIFGRLLPWEIPSWERGKWSLPGGNVRQTFTWIQNIP